MNRARLRRGLGIRTCVALAILVACTAHTASAQQSALTLRESLFERFANAVELHFEQPFDLTPLCNDTVEVDVNGFVFEIESDSVTVEANVEVAWCDFTGGGTLSTQAAVVLDSQARVIRVETESTHYQPSLIAFGVEVVFPFTIDIGKPLSIPDIPLGSADFQLTPIGGTGTLQVASDSLTLVQFPGRFELRGDVDLF